jgi:hypothetical protein
MRVKSLSRTIILSLAIPVLAGAAAISTVIAHLYSDLAQAQKAANAAVVAGARFLPASPDSAVRTAKSCATLNGIRPDEILSTEIGPDHLSITISISRSVPYVFSKVFRLGEGELGIVATARVSLVGQPHRLVTARYFHSKAAESTDNRTDYASDGTISGNCALNPDEYKV